MSRLARFACAVVIVMGGVIATTAALHASGSSPKRILVGDSVRHRPIVAVRVGDPDSPRKALVVGSIHGDEPAGAAIARQILRRFRDIGGVDLWVIKTVDPDGLAATPGATPTASI